MKILYVVFLIPALLCCSAWAQANPPAKPVYSLDELIARAMRNSAQISIAKLTLQKSEEGTEASRADRIPFAWVGPVASYVNRGSVLNQPVGTLGFLTGPGIGAEGFLDTKLFELPKLNHTVRRSSLQTQSAQLDLNQATQQVVFSVMSAFYDALLDQELLRVSEASQQSAQKHLQQTQQLYDAGKLAKYDVMRAQVRLANIEPQIIRNRSSLRQHEEALARLAGLNITQEFELRGSLEPGAESFDYQHLLQTATQNRADLKKLGLSEDIQTLTAKIDGAREPVRLTAEGEYVHYWISNNVVSSLGLSTYNFYVHLNIPLFGASHSHLRKQAEIEAAIINKQVEDLRTSIQADLAQKMSKLDESSQIVAAQGENVKRAEESLRVGELSYENGKTTILAVEDSEQDLRQARSDYVQALHDYAIDVLQIKKAAGLPLHSGGTTP